VFFSWFLTNFAMAFNPTAYASSKLVKNWPPCLPNGSLLAPVQLHRNSQIHESFAVILIFISTIPMFHYTLGTVFVL